MAYNPSPQLLVALRSALRPSVRHGRNPCSASRKAPRCSTSQYRSFQADVSPSQDPPIPFRKQLKEEAKARKLAAQTKPTSPVHKSSKAKDALLAKWELTVGIEIHAELNTTRKLFSPAQTSLNDTPNTHVSVFDAAMPGAQPQFQTATLLPAVRAAIALGCEVQRKSGWDRKHYFWWDQPNGYQITQYYHPFAKNGSLTLYPHDDIDPADHPSVTIGIKQIQMEQDTAKTILQPPSTHLLDFNRVSHPLIEIITLPQLHTPKTAAALVRKVQAILKAVNASTTGMEMGGLRADVNVSVRRRDRAADEEVQGLEYGGVTGLGQRTEIKNLSSFKAVEDAVVAERDRQIAVLEAGGVVEGETRGWTLGGGETKRLRGKEGEVDYRYMPDPDLGAVVIGEDLIEHLRTTLPALPDETLHLLTTDPAHGLTAKDAKTLLSIDDGDRLDYYFSVTSQLHDAIPATSPLHQKAGRLAANWILHDLPPHPHPLNPATSTPLSALLLALLHSTITLPTAKALLPRCLADPHLSIPATLDAEGLRLVPLSDAEYAELAKAVVRANEGMAGKVREEVGRGREKGKVMWFVGQMVRMGEEGRVQPERAERTVRVALGLDGEG